MEHKQFNIISLIVLCLIIISAICFNYIASINDLETLSQKHNEYLKILLKVLPMAFVIGLNLIYFFIYRITVYSIFNMGCLFFCFIGDILVGLYDPNIAEVETNKNIYIIFGGAIFFLARILWTVIFMIKPYKNISCIHYMPYKILISHAAWITFFILLALPLLLQNTKLVTVLAFVYIGISFGFPISYAFLRLINRKRINILPNESFGIANESFIAVTLSFLGILLFNISDLLLLYTIQTNLFPNYVILISDNIYWLSMYLLTISIVRSPDKTIEKGSYSVLTDEYSS